MVRRMVAAMVGGWVCGLLIAGVLGRLVMRIVASESSPSVQGMLTDDQEPVGEITFGGSLVLGLTGASAGAVAALGYLLALRVLPTSTPIRSAVFAIFGAVVGGALFVHSYDSFDYSRLDPVWFSVGSFVALPALFGLVLPTVVDTLTAPDGWVIAKAPMALVVIGAVLFSGPFIFVSVPAFVLALLVASVPVLQRVWSSRFTTIVGVAVLIALMVLGALDLAVDISSIRAQEPRGCPLCLDD